MASSKRFWLFKSEPDVYSIDDLQKEKTCFWEGVRNYQARNFMREMKVGERGFFYHSNAKPPGIVGLIKVAKKAHPDFTAWDPKSKYFDKRSSPEKPMWEMVDVAFVKKFKNPISLAMLKKDPYLTDMLVVKKGMRLSIQPVETHHFEHILKLAK